MEIGGQHGNESSNSQSSASWQRACFQKGGQILVNAI
jgi:hypothetical protein